MCVYKMFSSLRNYQKRVLTTGSGRVPEESLLLDVQCGGAGLTLPSLLSLSPRVCSSVHFGSSVPSAATMIRTVSFQGHTYIRSEPTALAIF